MVKLLGVVIFGYAVAAAAIPANPSLASDVGVLNSRSFLGIHSKEHVVR